jgi:apolipoprotein N-acyltransferase
MNSAPDPSTHRWFTSTWAIGLVGGILMWAALPPLALGWLAWVAPVPWLWLVRAEQLPGHRNYRALWLAAFVFWLLTLQWLRLPHPATSLGWLALSAYLACYLPIFVGLTRIAVHRLRLPLWLAAPVVWTGLEFARAHLFTGFLIGSIAHTQAQFPVMIQISDLVGEYGLDFVVILVAACITCIAFAPRRPLAAVPAALAITATLGYGYLRLSEAPNMQIAVSESSTGPRIALIQGNSLAEWKADPSRERNIMDEYLALSDRALQVAAQETAGRSLDLIVWPETMFRTGMVSFDQGHQLPAELGRTKEEISAYATNDLASLVRRLRTPVLVGIDRTHLPATPSGEESPPPSRYNSATLVGTDGKIIGTYDKIHPVMFGEYIPFARSMPFLYRLTPLTGGITAGSGAVGLKLDGIVYAPNICYETVIPHVIRRQVAELNASDESPHVLVNLTNDAWYWGSSALDMHLVCGMFRAVETRRPLVIAANGGISAWVDHFGRVRKASPRMQPDVIIADVELSNMNSIYVTLGDWFAAACLTCCIMLAIIGWRTRQKPQSLAPKP